MTKKTPAMALVSAEREERYKKIARNEVGQLAGIERERARCHLGYSFDTTTVAMKPKKGSHKVSPFPHQIAAWPINDSLFIH